MKIFFLISALILAPLSFASYHGEGNTGGTSGTGGTGSNNNNSGGGYGGSDALAIAGVIALVGGLAYYFTRDAKDEDEAANALTSLNSNKFKKFEIDFNNNLGKKFYSFHSNGLEEPQNHLQININYKLN